MVRTVCPTIVPQTTNRKIMKPNNIPLHLKPDTKIFCRIDNLWTVAMDVEALAISQASGRPNDSGGELFNFAQRIEVLMLGPGNLLKWVSASGVMIQTFPTLTLRALRQKTVPVTIARDGMISTFDPVHGIVRIPAKDAVGKIVPVIRQLPECDSSIVDNVVLALFLGAFISDGWINERQIGHTKANGIIRRGFLECWSRLRGAPASFYEYSETHRAEDNGIGGESTKTHISLKNEPEMKFGQWLQSECYHPDAKSRTDEERSCLFKRLPPGFLSYSRRTRLALLAGLIDGDGSVSLNHSRRTAQVLISFATSSPYLADDVQVLLLSLGIRSGISTTKPQAGRIQTHDAYTISISTPDVHALMNEIPLVTDYEGWNYLRENPPVKNDRDLVPIWPEIARHIRSRIKWTDESKAKRNSMAGLTGPKATTKLISREGAAWYADQVPVNDDTDAMKRWRAIVANVQVGWDTIAEVIPGGCRKVYGVITDDSGPIAVSGGLIV